MNDLTRGLPDEEVAIVQLIAEWVNEEVQPRASEFEHADRYPDEWIETMKAMGVFGLRISAPYGEVAVSVPCFAAVAEELARGWMSLAGAMGSHSVIATLIARFGTLEQQQRYLPTMATGELRAAMALTEPSGGSDLQAITTTARLEGDTYIVNGSKTWISNALHARVIAVLCKTDPTADPSHRGISILLAKPGPGLTISQPMAKLGYKGIESCELSFSDYQVPADALLGGVEGEGFAQMMSGLEIGRIQVAARATGVARAAFDQALQYSQERHTFGKPIWQHQAIGQMLAEMATRLQAARALLRYAADRLEEGDRCDLEAGMAKLFASEVCLDVTRDALRVHGGYGYSPEFPIERYYRDAPLMVVGEGTNEILRNVIAKQLIGRGELS